MTGTWSADVLPGFEARAIGPATLVRAVDRPEHPRAAFLHVHGYNDYFFQTHLAQWAHAQNLAFFAVDLRNAGRSLSEGDVPHFMTDVAEHGDDLETAAAAIGETYPSTPLIVHAHSTGGLSAAIWAADRPAPALAGLILDSPFLHSHFTPRQRLALRAVPAMAKATPQRIVSSGPSTYGKRMHVDNGGRWSFDTTWKNAAGVPVRAAWLHAVRQAQARVARGLDVDVPVLVARSARSGPDSPDNPLLDSEDTVLDVEALRRLGERLGRNVTSVAIEGGVHDLTLSAPAPLRDYLTAVENWLHGVLV
ncbi:serine aminopeptidase domain-containing protein [Demequina pelophila]|uniref:serine aminopeptidase domain-containing protein n=1 Tax=Demequina pelophila TaxID=1638984 RepID=UPI000781DCB1|nr:alpha/beta hydrolase [Demequina pelophila]